MFCKNCGAEINANERFCGKCGTPVSNTDETMVTGKTFVSPITESTSIDGSVAIMLIGSAACFILQIILWFVKFGKYSMSIEAVSRSESGSCSLNDFMEGTPLTAIVIIMMILAIGMCLMPIIKNNLNTYRKMIFAKIVSIINALGILIGISALSDTIKSNQEHFEYSLGKGFFEGSWSLTFGGWLNIIVTLATIILLFTISKKTKKYRNK